MFLEKKEKERGEKDKDFPKIFYREIIFKIEGRPQLHD